MNKLDLIALAQSRLLLETIPGATVLGEWRQVAQAATWMLRLRLELLGAIPTTYVPSATEWELVVDFSADSTGNVQLHPVDDAEGITATFPHQMFNGGIHPAWPCRNGHLCTVSGFDRVAANRNAWPDEPEATIPRICWHVKRATEWLALAAQGKLAKPGDPYELPDFNVPGATAGLLVFNEDSQSLAHWTTTRQESGIARLTSLINKPVHVIKGFFDSRNRDCLLEPEWGDSIQELASGASYRAFWLRLPALPVVNGWQVPATIPELREAVAQQGKDLDGLLAPLWKQLPDGDLLLLIGAPIPEVVDGSPIRYHWQALRLAMPSTHRVKPKARENTIKNHLRSRSALHWLPKAENWHPEVLQNRGRLQPSLTAAKVVMLGAGALGSNLAEQLVRMGLKDLTVVDADWLEAGNLVRHTLTLQDLFRNKAEALAERLNRSNPTARVRSLVLKAPSVNKAEALEQSLQQATLVIDATASDQLLKSMPLNGLGAVPFVSCSLGLEAKDLFFYAALAPQFSWEEFSAWYAPFRQVQNDLAQQMKLPRDVGCWQPLIPARLNRIAALAGIAVELIEQAYEQPETLPAKLRYEWPNPKLKPSAPESIPMAETELSSAATLIPTTL